MDRWKDRCMDRQTDKGVTDRQTKPWKELMFLVHRYGLLDLKQSINQSWSMKCTRNTLPTVPSAVLLREIWNVAQTLHCAVSPWYDLRGWLGVKQQVSIYLSTLCCNLLLKLTVTGVCTVGTKMYCSLLAEFHSTSAGTVCALMWCWTWLQQSFWQSWRRIVASWIVQHKCPHCAMNWCCLWQASTQSKLWNL